MSENEQFYSWNCSFSISQMELKGKQQEHVGSNKKVFSLSKEG